MSVPSTRWRATLALALAAAFAPAFGAGDLSEDEVESAVDFMLSAAK